MLSKSETMNNSDIERLVRNNIRSLCPYSTARDEYKGPLGIFLDANESPYPTGWNRYPDPRQTEVKKMIAAIKGTNIENIFVGNGSDEAIDLIFRVFCEPGKDNVVAITPSYGMYGVSAHINDTQVREVQLGEDFSLPGAKLLSSCDHNTKAIFLCSPNNPSGNAFTQKELLEIIENFNGIVVVDEAYIDFSSTSSLLPQIDTHPNLIILQTCSKARGLAALRLGLAFAQPYIIRLMSMVKYPYNINDAAQKLAIEALQRPIDAEVRQIVSERERVSEALGRCKSVRKVYHSDANFILVKVDDADRLYEKMIADGIIVRNRTKVTGCKDCLRITIGLPQENDRMLKSISDYEESNIR